VTRRVGDGVRSGHMQSLYLGEDLQGSKPAAFLYNKQHEF